MEELAFKRLCEELKNLKRGEFLLDGEVLCFLKQLSWEFNLLNEDLYAIMDSLYGKLYKAGS